MSAHATHPAQCILVDLITVIISGDEYGLGRFSLCSFLRPCLAAPPTVPQRLVVEQSVYILIYQEAMVMVMILNCIFNISKSSTGRATSYLDLEFLVAFLVISRRIPV